MYHRFTTMQEAACYERPEPSSAEAAQAQLLDEVLYESMHDDEMTRRAVAGDDEALTKIARQAAIVACERYPEKAIVFEVAASILWLRYCDYVGRANAMPVVRRHLRKSFDRAATQAVMLVGPAMAKERAA